MENNTMIVKHLKSSTPYYYRAVIVFAILMSLSKSFAQNDPDGYISINCGSNVTRSYAGINLTWTEDEDYIFTGTKGAVQYELSSTVTVNREALQSFRYFPQRRNKYCYELPMKASNASFLIRAMFLHGSSSELPLPINFDVYVNATHWITVNYAKGDDLFVPKVKESIFFLEPGGNRTDVCLVPNKGVPFISSLELRQLDPEGVMYSESFENGIRKGLFFSNLIRLNLGVQENAPTLRYPDDRYDRLWTNTDSYEGSYPTTSRNLSVGPKLNKVPLKVMEDAWYGTPNYRYYFHIDLPDAAAGSQTYCIFYFALMNESSYPGENAAVYIYLDSEHYPGFNLSNLPTMKSYFHVLIANYTFLTLPGYGLINALEFYEIGSVVALTTEPYDVEVMKFLKTTFNMTTWQGDPCTPVPYDWIKCEFNYVSNNWNIISLNLSHLQNSTRLTELGYIHPATQWDSGCALHDLRITHSNVDSSTFQSLLENYLAVYLLESLDLSHNNINVLPDSQIWATILGDDESKLYSLNLSYNNISKIPLFANYPFSTSLQILDLAYNQMKDLFPYSSYVSLPPNLQILNLSNNDFSSSVPVGLSSLNLPHLQVLDISHNHFTGDLPSYLNFSSLQDQSSFQILNADSNSIEGVLDLREWHQNLQTLSQKHTNYSGTLNIIFNQSFSLLNNKITDIFPRIEEFEDSIAILIHTPYFNESGVLLGGNPYCTQAKSFAQRYLCRYSTSETVFADEKKKSKNLIIISSVFGGSALLLCFLTLSFTIWRLLRKVHALKEIQQELAHRRVQPPLYSYHDIKLATQNFHRGNSLGEGTFGAVYKGVLPDGTTIAVKRLFNSKQKQVLEEFLNEVVLINGTKHKNLVQLQGCCIENEERILVYEFAENGNLADALWGKGNGRKLDWKERFNVCVGIARGLCYLHEELHPGIIHRDIKPANVLLDENRNAKIADFGLAKLFPGEDKAYVSHVAGTKGYFSPEYAVEGKLTTKADVYSYGILVLEIVSGRKCLDYDPNLPPDQMYLKTWAESLQKSESLPDMLEHALRTQCAEGEVVKVIKIALMCVRNDPHLRPSMSEVGTMLLEGKERTYDILDSALSETDVAMSLRPILEMFSETAETSESDASSSLFTSKTLASQDLSLASRSSSGIPWEPEELPLMHSHSAWTKLSSQDRKKYLLNIRPLKRSISEKLFRGSDLL